MRHRRKSIPRSWTDAEREYVLAHRREPTRKIAEALGRSLAGVQSFIKNHGIRCDRRTTWTDAERKIIIDAAAKGESPMKTRERLPGRSLTQVYQFRIRLGVGRSVKHLYAGVDAFIRMHHPRQLSDMEIADLWNRSDRPHLDRRTIGDHRNKLGLPFNGQFTDRARERVRRKTREQLEKAGLPNLCALERKIVRDRIVALGWPPELRWREAQILTLIWERGPQTKREICDALGMPFRGARNTLTSNGRGGTYMATLMRRGLLVSFRRAVQTGRRGGKVDIYSLPLNIERRKVNGDVKQ